MNESAQFLIIAIGIFWAYLTYFLIKDQNRVQQELLELRTAYSNFLDQYNVEKHNYGISNLNTFKYTLGLMYELELVKLNEDPIKREEEICKIYLNLNPNLKSVLLLKNSRTGEIVDLE